MEIIKIENLVKIYKTGEIEVKAVNNINLSFLQGEFTAIVGPSGSGKTTLLNLIGGLDKPSAGKIFVNKTDITQLTENQLIEFRLQNIGFVFQAYNLIPVLTAWENIEFILELKKIKKSERKKRVEEMLRAVNLYDKKDFRPSQMSGGEQQRIAVARALAPKPKFILADEPTANLDSQSAENLLNIMLKLNQAEKITFIFSTHDPRIMQKARRIITLRDGKIEK